MTTVTTKRSIRSFFFMLYISLSLFGYSAIIFEHYIQELNSGHHIGINGYIGLFLGCVFFSVAVYAVYFYVKNSPTITIDKHTIRFGLKEVYNVADINNIMLTGKKPSKYRSGNLTKGAIIEFSNGKTKKIIGPMYSNSWQIKLFMEQVIINKKECLEVNSTPIDSAELRYAQVEYYKGIQLLTFRGLLLWAPIGCGFAHQLFSNHASVLLTTNMILVYIVIAGWIAFNSWFMNYFGVSRDYFVVKNHVFIWKKKLYRIDNIKEVIYNNFHYKLPNCLTIITKDYRSNFFQACTLSDKTWLELKKALEERGITVRNECI